jgi:hypothetical protein
MFKKLLLLLIGIFCLYQTSYGAIAKSGAEVCNWTIVAQNTVVKTSPVTITGNYQTALTIDAALVTTTATTNGLGIVVQTSTLHSRQ